MPSSLLATLKASSSEHSKAAQKALGDWLEIVLGRNDAQKGAEDSLLVDVGDGRCLKIDLQPDKICFWGTTDPEEVEDEEHGGMVDVPGANLALDDLVWQLAQPLAKATRWGLHTERGVAPYLPEKSCHQCQAGLFDDEDICPSCSTPVPDTFPEPASRANKLFVPDCSNYWPRMV